MPACAAAARRSTAGAATAPPAFAEAHAQVQQRVQLRMLEQAAVCRLGRAVAGEQAVLRGSQGWQVVRYSRPAT